MAFASRVKILVVTPTRGLSPWISETISSIEALRLDFVHVLVAPEGVVSALNHNFPSTRVIAEPGGGMYAAINAGIAATSDWDALTYINDDDTLLPAFVKVAAAADGAGARIAYGGVRLIDARGRRLGAIPISPDPALNRALYAQRLEPVYQHGTVITRAAFEALGGFDASFRFCGDSEFLARACVTNLPFVCATRREVAAFRLRAGQLTKNRNAMTAERVRVDEKLGLLAPRLTAAHRRARWRFRLANLPIYAERICRHGFISFDQLLAREG